MTDLKIDWASGEAARYACTNWHYSKSVPMGGLVRIGVWENSKFIGVVLFSHGTNRNIGKPYRMTQYECVELTRVALAKHQTPVSRIMAIALKFLRSHCPGLKMVVSFADPSEGHHGGIYQAGNWIYAGLTSPTWEYRLNGKRLNKRAFTGERLGKPARKVPKGAVRVDVPGKHRYLFPLEKDTKAKLSHLSMPYPSRPKQATVGTPDERQCNADPDAPL